MLEQMLPAKNFSVFSSASANREGENPTFLCDLREVLSQLRMLWSLQSEMFQQVSSPKHLCHFAGLPCLMSCLQVEPVSVAGTPMVLGVGEEVTLSAALQCLTEAWSCAISLARLFTGPEGWKWAWRCAMPGSDSFPSTEMVSVSLPGQVVLN